MNPILLAFLEDIKANPCDNTPRLILADWLEENGTSVPERERAGLIRAQCRLETLSARDPERKRLEQEIDALRKKHHAPWTWALFGGRKHWASGPNLERGLLVLSCCPRDFQALAPHGNDPSWAWVERIYLHGYDEPGFQAGFWSGPHLNTIARIDTGWGLDLRGTFLPGLWQSPCLDGLRTLTLTRADYTIDDALPLLDWPRLGQLRNLGLSRLPLPDDFLPRLIDSPHLGQPQRLALNETRTGSAGFLALARSPRLDRLLQLDLRENTLVGKDLRALATAPLARSVRDLWLNLNRSLRDEGARALAENRLPALRNLRLGACRIGSWGGDALAEAPWLRHLETLELDLNALGASGTALLAAPLASLRGLKMDHCELTPDCLRSLAGNTTLRNLRHLDLRSNPLGPDLAATITGHDALANLAELELDHTGLTDTGLDHLARWPGLARLIYLGLQDNDLHNNAVRRFLESPHLRPETYLDLASNRLSSGLVDWARRTHRNGNY